MWKWLGGCMVVGLVLVIGASYYAFRKYREFAERGGPAVVTIAASPERVFASISHGDSLESWMDVKAGGRGTRVTPSRRGPLVVGDTIRVEILNSGDANRTQLYWVVSQVVPPTLLVMETRNERTGRVALVRRDSLIPHGDSTRVFSTISPALPDSLPGGGPAAGESRDRGATPAPALLLPIFRLQLRWELERLRSRIEEGSAPVGRQTGGE